MTAQLPSARMKKCLWPAPPVAGRKCLVASAEAIRRARKKTVGIRQTLKAVERGLVRTVVVAQDADAHRLRALLASCERQSVTVTYIESMKMLGEASGIKVGAAAAAVLEE